MKNNKITVRFSDEELEKLKTISKSKNIKVATLIREATLNAITNNELLSNKDELKQFIVETIEEANDKKLGRIISLLFRATSHIDVVREQNDIYFRTVHNLYSWSNNINDYKKYNDINHPITDMAKMTIKERDEENIEKHNFRRKSG